MNRWRGEIEAHAAAGDASALDVLLAVGQFQSALRRQASRRKIADALFNLGEAACAYVQAESVGPGAADLPFEWRAALQAILDDAKIPLEVVLAMERDRFDMDLMVADEARSSGRNFVHTPLSWAVRDTSTPAARVLHHARVITD